MLDGLLRRLARPPAIVVVPVQAAQINDHQYQYGTPGTVPYVSHILTNAAEYVLFQHMVSFFRLKGDYSPGQYERSRSHN